MHLRLNVDPAELAGASLCAEDVGKIHSYRQDLLRHPDKFGKMLVPFHEPQIMIDDHQPVWHACQGGLPLRSLATSQFSEQQEADEQRHGYNQQNEHDSLHGMIPDPGVC